jgi:aspartyl-tRNA(Asn)/glutamyl-tRNA(Gln) amidotransferase subunit B
MNNYEPVVGMEIHVELKTKSKMFCGCVNDPFGAAKPNIYTCPVCLAMPGGLPVANKKAIEWTIKLGLALGSEIPLFSKFDRKHYFYPDLPKGYQISQYDQPLVVGGLVRLPLGNVRIHRVHLEEDTARNQHKTVNGKKVTLVDFNRGGVPLVEIVTEPDIKSGEQARQFLKKLHQIVRYLDISDADMEKGSMRLEPNISVRKVGESHLPNYKVEVKNINSFAFVKKAIEFEMNRHIEFLEKGQNPPQETRGWNEDKGITFAQRTKENAADYRYFPDPDIPPLVWTREYIQGLEKTLPELPDTKKERFIKSFGLSEYDAELLTDSIERASYFESCVQLAPEAVSPKMIANWIINKKADANMSPEAFVGVVAKASIVEEVADDVIQKAVDEVLAANPKAVADFKSGKIPVKMFLFGTILKSLGGKGDKGKVMSVLEKALT